MKDTDWRPSPCPSCGVMRHAERQPRCHNSNCNFNYTGDTSNKNRTMKTEQKYVWRKRSASEELFIIDDLTLLFKNPDFDADNDQIFELGPEVKLKMDIVAIPAQRITRDHSWENKE
jgi:hypothetical protein